MNNGIEKFYLDGIDSNEFTEDFIRKAIAIGIRCDNVNLARQQEKYTFAEISMDIILQWNLQLKGLKLR